jgi:hypothetical protein
MPEASQYTSNYLVISGCASTGDVVNNFFNVWNASSQSLLQTYLVPFFNISVIDFEILEKFRMIIASQPKETTYLSYRRWWLPVQHIFYIAEVHYDSFW